jgi:hypothetical protein
MRIKLGKYEVMLFCNQSFDKVGKNICIGFATIYYKQHLLIKKLYAYKITLTTNKRLHMQFYKRNQVQQKAL